MRGEISLIHLAHHVPNSPHITTLRCYIHSPYQFLQAWGSWHTWGLSPSHSHFWPSVSANPFPPSVPQHYNFQTIQWWLACIDVVPLGCGPSILLAFPQSQRQSVEFVIHACARSQAYAHSNGYPVRLYPNMGNDLWSTDGSCVGDVGKSPSVTSAVIGPVQLASRIFGMHAASNHGEVLALVMASILASSSSPLPSSSISSSSLSSPSPSSPPSQIFADHLHSICLIQDIHSTALPPNFWSFSPAQSYYRWLLMLLEDSPQLFFGHIRAHTSSTDAVSILNRVADRLAVTTHMHPFSQIALLPTFALDQYTMWAGGVGFIENNFSLFVDGELARIHATSLHYTSGDRFPHPPISIPQSFPYERSTSSYSALVQLYARSGQLPTRRLLFLRGMAPSFRCRFGCYGAETPHHLCF